MIFLIICRPLYHNPATQSNGRAYFFVRPHMSGVLKHGDLAESHPLQHLPLLFDLGEFGLPVLALAGVFGGKGRRVVLEGHCRYAGGDETVEGRKGRCLLT